jgi:glycine oxidase
MQADCMVLGGGLVGCLTALRLAQRRLAVTLVERGRVGGEASGAAAGILAPQAEAHAPGAFLELALRSRAQHLPLAEELRDAVGVDVGYRAEGALVVAHDDAGATALGARAAWQRARGLRVETLAPDAIAGAEPSLAPVRAALHLPDDHQVDARRLVRAVEAAARRAGVTFIAAEARRLRVERARLTGVEIDGDSVGCGRVVLALGAWSARLDGAGLPPRAVTPVRGQLVALRTPLPPVSHVVFGAGGYLVPRADGRVLVGSTEERVGFVKQTTAAGLAELCTRALTLCPALGAAPVERFWSGLRPASPDGLPLVGPTSVEGLFVATGHYRNGVLLAPLTAEVMAALVTGARPPVDLAPLDPARF